MESFYLLSLVIVVVSNIFDASSESLFLRVLVVSFTCIGIFAPIKGDIVATVSIRDKKVIEPPKYRYDGKDGFGRMGYRNIHRRGFNLYCLENNIKTIPDSILTKDALAILAERQGKDFEEMYVIVEKWIDL